MDIFFKPNSVQWTYFWALLLFAAPIFARSYDEAEKLYAEGSYRLAMDAYQKLTNLPSNEISWVKFRMADCTWRSQARTRQRDTTTLENAKNALEKLIRDVIRDEDKDRLWVEIQESLGDYQRAFGGQHKALSHYHQALDWWAGSTELNTARKRYLEIIWKIQDPSTRLIESGLRIAQSSKNRGRLYYLLSKSLHQTRKNHNRIIHAYKQAIKAGRKSSWFDDALYSLGRYLEHTGKWEKNGVGDWQNVPDYESALKAYRNLTHIFKKGESRYLNNAHRRIAEITGQDISLQVEQFFLPGSNITFSIQSRNINVCNMAIYPIDFNEINFKKDDHRNQWLDRIEIKDISPTKKWTESIFPSQPHEPTRVEIILADQFKPGAYLLEVRSDEKNDREIILITESALLIKTINNKALVYFCKSSKGTPIAKANIALYRKHYDAQLGKNNWEKFNAITDKNGLALITMPERPNAQELFVGAHRDNHQAFAMGYGYQTQHAQNSWKIFALTDRPAYRPEDTAHWKITARMYDGSTYQTPQNVTLKYSISGSRGKIEEGTVKLNRFGSAWGSILLNDEMALGMYHINFQNMENHSVGRAQLFRLEEYKLPEYKVTVSTGNTTLFRIGDKISAVIHAEYFFGGPVANANVEVIVQQKPIFQIYKPVHEYPWHHTSSIRPPHWEPGQEIKRERLKTDGDGNAIINFSSENLGDQDMEFTITARVTDASLREISGVGVVKVTRFPYIVRLRPEHNIYRPGDSPIITLTATDANKNPIAAQGEATVFLRRNARFQTSDMGVVVTQKIASAKLTMNNKGHATFQFKASEEGNYVVYWTSADSPEDIIESQCELWVSSKRVSDIGYHHGGVDLIVDKDTFNVGEKTPVLITIPEKKRYVLFTIEGDDLYHYDLVHLKGNSTLLQLDITETFTPNIFLNASLISEHMLLTDHQEIFTPPKKNFLDVQVDFDRAFYQPGEKVTIQLTTRNHRNKAVSAEVSLSAFDASLLYIQQELSNDPRKFFYGNKRSNHVRTYSVFEQKPFLHYEEEVFFDDFEDFGGAVARNLKDYKGAYAMEEHTPELASTSLGADFSFGAPEAPSPINIRSDFRNTLFWQPDIITGKDGKAEVEIEMPDSLTTWQALARAATEANHFGTGENNAVTKLPLMVRLQTPRFFTAGDSATISAIINNKLDEALNVTPEIDVKDLEFVEKSATPIEITLPPHSETNVHWQVRATHPGQAKIMVKARGDDYSDRMSKTCPVYAHGIEKLLSKSGKVISNEVSFTINLPEERQKDTTTLTIQIAPSLAFAMLDALPYLIDYPYGCTEQTMSRFLPAAIVAKTLKDLRLDSVDIENRIFGGIEAAFADKTHPENKKQWDKLGDVIKKSLKRLYDFQHQDGGWSWWKEGKSNPFMSAYVVWGLSLAKQAEIVIDETRLQQGFSFLREHLIDAENQYDLLAWMLHALSYEKITGPSVDEAVFNLWKNKDTLNAYSRALFALAMHHYGRNMEADVLAKNLQNGVTIDQHPDESILLGYGASDALPTSHWGKDTLFYRWSEGGIEATAFVLQALLAITPESELIESTVNWLIKNRRGAQWSNTRDSAIVLLALNKFLKASKELSSAYSYGLLVNEKVIFNNKEMHVHNKHSFEIDRSFLRNGSNKIQLLKYGKGPLYYSIFAKYFSLEDPVPSAGNEIFIARQYHKILQRPTLLKGATAQKVSLNDGGQIKSGERVEVILTIEAKNDYEYLIFEDLKPAGFESTQLQSGERLFARQLKSGAAKYRFSGVEKPVFANDYTGVERRVYQELRDRKTALFLDRLPEGYWEIRYVLRAERPGNFHALPVLGHAMYAPEIKCNGSEIRLKIK